MKYCVYCHTNKINGKRYVGVTKNIPEKRWQNGRGYINNEYFYNAITKYGWHNFSHEILYFNLCKEDAETLEISIISEWGLTDRKNGYNIQSGGNLGKKLAKDTKEKLSRAHKGKTMSVETKKKMSDAQKKRITPDERKRRSDVAKRLHSNKEYTAKIKNANKSKYSVGQYTKDGELVKIYHTLYDAVVETGYDKSNILACLSGRQLSCKGFVWKKEIKK